MQMENNLYEYIRTFDIKFHETSILAFYTGDIIHGNVYLNIKQDVSVESIFVHVRGESFVYCQDTEKVGIVHDNHCIIKDHQKFWNVKINVWENETVPIPVGRHEFPFSISIPNKSSLPSSFESRFGAIRYWIKVAVLQDENNELCKYKPFTVLQKIDVSKKDYMNKISNEVEKTSCCFCFNSGAVQLSAFLPRTGFCPGESIPVNCRGRNRGRKIIGGLKARLIQKVKFVCGDKTRTIENVVSAIGGGPIEKGRTKVWENQLLKVPAIPPTILNSPNIKVVYRVQVTMAVPNGVDMQFHLPVIIGTLPQTNDDPISKPIVKLYKCTQGVECFNHSSKIYDFPLQAYVPYCACVENFTFVSKGLVFRESKHKRSQSMTQRKKFGTNDEKQPLLRSFSAEYS